MKTFNFNISSIISIFLFGLLIFFQVKSHNYKKESESNIIAMTEELQLYKTKYNQEVASRRSVQLDNDKFKFLNDSILEVVKKFKKPQTVIVTETVVRVDTIMVPYEVPIQVAFNKPFSFGDKFYHLSGLSTNLGIRFDSIRVYNEQSIVFGQKKKGIIFADVTNTNPYIQTKNIQSYTYRPKKSWHEKWYITIPTAVVAGFIIAK